MAPRGSTSFIPPLVSSALASAIRSRSTSDLPTSRPRLAKNVHAIAPPIRMASHFGQQRLDDVDLPADLGAAEHRDERTLRLLEGGAEVLQLLLHQKPGDRGLEQMGHRLGGGVGAVRRAEGVVHVEIAQRGELPGQRRIVLLLAGPEARVLDESDAAAGQPPRHRHAGGQVLDELERDAEHPLHVAQDLAQRVLGIRTALGTAEVRQQDDPRAVLAQIPDRGQRGADAGIVGDGRRPSAGR